MDDAPAPPVVPVNPDATPANLVADLLINMREADALHVRRFTEGRRDPDRAVALFGQRVDLARALVRHLDEDGGRLSYEVAEMQDAYTVVRALHERQKEQREEEEAEAVMSVLVGLLSPGCGHERDEEGRCTGVPRTSSRPSSSGGASSSPPDGAPSGVTP